MLRKTWTAARAKPGAPGHTGQGLFALPQTVSCLATCMLLDSSTSPRTHKILGCLLEVHRELGSGFEVEVYQEATSLELMRASVPFVRNVRIPIWFQGHLLDVDVRAQFICWGEVLVGLAATESPTEMEQAAMRAHLRASRMPVGLLLHFGGKRLQVRRFVRLDAPAVHALPVPEPGDGAPVSEPEPWM